MNKYAFVITYINEKESNNIQYFLCKALDSIDAKKQCYDACPNVIIMTAYKEN